MSAFLTLEFMDERKNLMKKEPAGGIASPALFVFGVRMRALLETITIPRRRAVDAVAMTFTGLADSELYAHPRFSWLLELSFELAITVLYRKEILLPPDYKLLPGTLIVSNHQRESDVPILATVVCRHEGLRVKDPLPFFAMREDLLHRKALANLLYRWPRPLLRMLGLIPLGWLFHNVRTEPMRRIREFTLGETIEALCAAGLGEARPASIFSARGQHEIIAQTKELPACVADIDRASLGRSWRIYWGLRRLQLAALRKIAPRIRAEIRSELRHFAQLIEAGQRVYIAPEGTISLDGRFGRVRAGPREICRLSAVPVSVRPTAVSYDALGPRRLRVVLRVGEPLHDLDLADSRRFAATLRDAILRLCALTPSHLLARWLYEGPAQFNAADLAAWLQRATSAARDAGMTIDPLFSHIEPRELAEARLCWLRRKRLVERKGKTWRNVRPRDAQPGWAKPAQIVPYLANALTDFAPEPVRSLRP